MWDDTKRLEVIAPPVGGEGATVNERCVCCFWGKGVGACSSAGAASPTLPAWDPDFWHQFYFLALLSPGAASKLESSRLLGSVVTLQGLGDKFLLWTKSWWKCVQMKAILQSLG